MQPVPTIFFPRQALSLPLNYGTSAGGIIQPRATFTGPPLPSAGRIAAGNAEDQSWRVRMQDLQLFSAFNITDEDTGMSYHGIWLGGRPYASREADRIDWREEGYSARLPWIPGYYAVNPPDIRDWIELPSSRPENLHLTLIRLDNCTQELHDVINRNLQATLDLHAQREYQVVFKMKLEDGRYWNVIWNRQPHRPTLALFQALTAAISDGMIGVPLGSSASCIRMTGATPSEDPFPGLHITL